MGREDDYGTFWNLINFINEDDPLVAEGFYHELVVDDFVTDVDGGSELFDGFLHDVNGAVNTGAESARGSKYDFVH